LKSAGGAFLDLDRMTQSNPFVFAFLTVLLDPGPFKDYRFFSWLPSLKHLGPQEK
jgi:hypothetical protein